MADLQNRYDFVMLFDVQDGNPNGDPDAGNLPRVDPETGEGLVSDVCLKRKIRNYVSLVKDGADGYDIYVKEKSVLTEQQARAFEALGIDPPEKGNKKTKGDRVEKGRDWMCQHFYDVRTFGAVMSLKEKNCGQVRGPVQLTFSRSLDPIVTLEHSITRMAVATAKEAEAQGGDNRTMGRKSTVPYGLYRGYGFVSPQLAAQTGFGTDDLDLLWDALAQMFEHDRSAARGLMGLQRLVIFEHESPLGNAPARQLFDLVSAQRRDVSRPARRFEDYDVSIGDPPAGITVLTRP